MKKDKKSNNDDMTPEQLRYYKKIMMEEMIRKIERRIEESDEAVMKSIRNFMDDVPIDINEVKEKEKQKRREQKKEK